LKKRKSGANRENTKGNEDESVLNLRNMSREDALEKLDRQVDQAVYKDIPFFKILHGKGTGTLRDAIHEFLRNDNRIASFRDGAPFEGGWGVTVVLMKDDD
jgi:DNA mismatch repair protein MutS2